MKNKIGNIKIWNRTLSPYEKKRMYEKDMQKHKILLFKNQFYQWLSIIFGLLCIGIGFYFAIFIPSDELLTGKTYADDKTIVKSITGIVIASLSIFCYLLWTHFEQEEKTLRGKQ